MADGTCRLQSLKYLLSGPLQTKSSLDMRKHQGMPGLRGGEGCVPRQNVCAQLGGTFTLLGFFRFGVHISN